MEGVGGCPNTWKGRVVPTGRPTDRRSGTRRLVCGVEQRSGQWNTSRSDIPLCGLAAAALRADSRFVLNRSKSQVNAFTCFGRILNLLEKLLLTHRIVQCRNVS